MITKIPESFQKDSAEILALPIKQRDYEAFFKKYPFADVPEPEYPDPDEGWRRFVYDEDDMAFLRNKHERGE